MLRRLSKDQPENFKFTKVNLDWAKHQLKKYPKGRQASAVIPLLWKAQEQEGWVSKPAIEFVASFLDMPEVRVLEVATFYSMFNLEPIGKNFVQICRTTPCWLRGSDKLSKVAQEVCETNIGETSDDEIFTVVEVECLGACCNAPMVQINDDYYEDLDEESFKKILQDLKDNKSIKVGSQIGRKSSQPERKFDA